MDGIVALLLSKKFTKDTVIGMGAIKGAACQVQSINKVGKTTTIILKWEDNTGVSHTQSFDIEDGLDGTSIVSATIKPNGHLELGLSDGTSIDCGQVLPQYSTMPNPSASNVGQILQYIGTTTSNYTNGYFYECVNDGGVYKWVEKSVQDSYTKIEIGDLTNLPDNTKDVVQNIDSLKLSIDQLQASKLSISDIDDALSSTSENPVQNKVIKLTIDQLRGSLIGLIDEKEDKFRYTETTMLPADSTNVGKIVQYIGTTDSTYTNGYFYQCRETSIGSGVYNWVQKNVQPSSGGTGGDGVVDGYYNSADQLFYEEAGHINPITGDDNTLYVSLDTNLLYRYNGSIFIRVDDSGSGEDDVINGYYDSVSGKFYEDSAHTTEITGEVGKIYISIDTNIQYRWDNISVPNKFVTISSSIDVDNDFSTTSENPVQNKVITAKINDIDALIATKLSLDNVDSALSGSSLYPVQNKVIKVELDKLSASMLSASLKNKLINLEPIYLIGSGLNFNSSTGELTATGISIPIDDHLDASSINPVQNKAITLPFEALQGSVLTKMQKMLSAQGDNFAVFDNNGQVVDSNISKDIIPSSASASNKVLVESDVDNALSTISTNPVQNKEITVPLQALQGSIITKADKVSGATNDNFATLDANGNLKDSGINKDIVPNTASSSNQLATKNDIETYTGSDGVTIDGSNNITLDVSYLTASRVGYIPTTEKGTANGVAELNSTGKIPSSQLPSYVDDVIDGYLYDATHFYKEQVIGGYYNTVDGNFYEDSSYTQLITPVVGNYYLDKNTGNTYQWNSSTGSYVSATPTRILGEDGKIYISIDSNIQYRWTGTSFSALGGALQLGETSSTAYRGDRGKVAYDHSQIIDGSNPHNTTADNVNLKVPISALSGSKLDVESTLYGINTALGNKADKVSGATNGNFASLDSNGNLTDSGSKASDFATPNDLNKKADLIDIAPLFNDTTNYSQNDYVSYNGDIYKFTTNHTAGAWIGSDATQIVITTEFKNPVQWTTL